MKQPKINEYGNPIAKRLAGSRQDGWSYWSHNGEVYRLVEYEPVQFNIYGLPLGARWECSRGHWDQFAAQMFGIVA